MLRTTSRAVPPHTLTLLRATLAVVFALITLQGASAAQEAAPPLDDTQQAAADAALAYLRAVDEVDAVRSRQLLYAQTPAERALADAFADLLQATRRLQEAGSRRFTTVRAPVPEAIVPAVQAVTLADGRGEVSFVGREALPVVQAEGVWLIDTPRLVGPAGLFTPAPSAPSTRSTPPATPGDGTDPGIAQPGEHAADAEAEMREQARLIGEFTRVLRTTADEIDAGQYTRPDDAHAVLGQRLSEVIARGTSGVPQVVDQPQPPGRPADAPTTAPATTTSPAIPKE
ncbi:MAG: hypothetical protein ACFCVE_08325 [Phycisphaerae bacterium]